DVHLTLCEDPVCAAVIVRSACIFTGPAFAYSRALTVVAAAAPIAAARTAKIVTARTGATRTRLRFILRPSFIGPGSTLRRKNSLFRRDRSASPPRFTAELRRSAMQR